MSNNTTIVSGNGKEEVVVVVDHDNNLPEQIYNTLIVVQWVLNLTSLTMALYFMNRTKKTSLIHPNLRTLLIWTVVVPFNIMMVARMAQQLNESDWGKLVKSAKATNYACLFFRFFHDASLPLEATAILLITVERLLATVFRETYFMRGPVISVALAAFAYASSSIFSLLFVGYDIVSEKFDVNTNETCRTVYIHPSLVFVCWMLAGVTCYLSAAALFGIYKWNIHLMNAASAPESADLQTRYQHRENVAIMRALIPALAPYWILVLVGIGNAVYITFNVAPVIDGNNGSSPMVNASYTTIMPFTAASSSLSPRTTSWPRGAIEQRDVNFLIAYMIADIYGLIFKVVFICQYSPLRHRFIEDVCSLFCVGSQHRNKIAPRIQLPRYETDPKIGSELYFSQLQNRWQQT